MNDVSQVTIKELLTELESSDETLRNDVAQALLTYGRKSVPALIEALQSPSKRLAWEASKLLIMIEDPRWIEPMAHALTSDNILLAQVALQALSHYGNNYQLLLDAIPNCQPIMMPNIIAALAEMNIQEAIPTITHILKTTDYEVIRYVSIEALTELNSVDSLALIQTFANDENHHVRERVLLAVRKFDEQ